MNNNDLMPIQDIFSETEIREIQDRAIHKAEYYCNGSNDFELLYSKFYFEFLQEQCLRKCFEC